MDAIGFDHDFPFREANLNVFIKCLTANENMQV